MIYNNNPPIDKVLYAFAYYKNESKETNGLIAKPYKCIIKTDEELRQRKIKRGWGNEFCVKLKRNGDLSKSLVHYDSRSYADTYEEAVDGYNKLVTKCNDKLRKLIEENNKDRIILDK